jgi:hypothetical protein
MTLLLLMNDDGDDVDDDGHPTQPNTDREAIQGKAT